MTKGGAEFPVGIGFGYPRSQSETWGTLSIRPSMIADDAHTTELSALANPLEHHRFRMVDSKVHFLSRNATKHCKSDLLDVKAKEVVHGAFAFPDRIG
jgi:hypothetical protein